ncbi:hypothetical protein CUMW_208890 [Citrus unshiu]|uniref:Putative plant transposon protein domain-containing protein n=1 Tax=Citrus unshiu TaxID=55188 RepID=A0A2H5Q9H5_CITUN|nr:hypothetical protein CUMW_208890 [Citrus unshiu]
MTRKVLDTFYILLDWLRSLSIGNGNLLQLLEKVGWINALTIYENVYPDLVKIFYSNMDTSAEKENRVITNVGGVLIKFDDTELNSILRTFEYGLEIYSTRKVPTIDNFVHVDAVRNICRCINLSYENIVLPRSGHLDDVTHMDVVFIDSILRHRLVSLGYTIIRTMLSIPNLISRALPYGNFITHILKYFRVPINEPSYKPCRSIGDKVVYALRFERRNGAWVKREDPPSCEPDHNASASDVPPTYTHDSGKVTLQQLMDEVKTLSVQQTSFQQHVLEEHQHVSQQHHSKVMPTAAATDVPKTGSLLQQLHLAANGINCSYWNALQQLHMLPAFVSNSSIFG